MRALINSLDPVAGTGKMSDRRGERGIALLISIGFLALLSILGVIVIQLTGEGILSGRKDKHRKEAFSLGDGGVEYAMSLSLRPDVDLPEGTPLDLTTDDPSTGDENGDGVEDTYLDAFFPDDNIECIGPERCTITYEGSDTNMPANATRYDASISAANAKIYRYFHIVMETRHRTDSAIPPVKIDALMAQAFPALTGIPVEVVSGKMATPDSGGN